MGGCDRNLSGPLQCWGERVNPKERTQALTQALRDCLRVMAQWEATPEVEKTRVQLNAAVLVIKPGRHRRQQPEILTEDVKELFERGQRIMTECSVRDFRQAAGTIWPEGALVDRGPEETEEERDRR
jgi:hypothetical protein